MQVFQRTQNTCNNGSPAISPVLPLLLLTRVAIKSSWLVVLDGHLFV